MKEIRLAMSKIDIHDFVASLVETLESKDIYTAGHSERVAKVSERIAIEMGFNKEQVFIVHISAHLHDIGKVGVKDSVLTKPGLLKKNEIIEIQMHSQIGFKILSRVKIFQKIALIVKHHHERFDGRGYPDGLKGELIPIESRIIAIADSFDAMTSSRPYRSEMSIKDTVNEIIFHKGDQFDPKIVDIIQEIYRKDYAFLKSIPPIYHGKYKKVKHKSVAHSRKVNC